MKYMKHTILAVVSIVALAGFAVSNVSAEAVFKVSDTATNQIAKGDTVDGSAYVAGNTVRVSGIVKGDLYCAGSNVTIDGTVEGDVLCAGATVTLSGVVKGDVRLAGATIVLGGTVDGSASVVGADVTTSPSLKLARDLTGATGNLTVNGTIGRDVTAGAATLTVNGIVNRDVISALGTASISSDARIKGNFSYTSDSQTTVPAGVVGGKTAFTRSATQDTGRRSEAALNAAFVVLILVGFGVMIMLGVILFPRQVHEAGAVSWARFGIAAVVGLTFIVTAPLVAILLLLTGVGMVVSYVLMLTWLLLMAVSAVPFAYFVGTKLYGSRTPHVLVRATIGALVVMLALLIPIVNIVTALVMVCVGTGLILSGVPKLYQNSPYHVREETTVSKKKVA